MRSAWVCEDVSGVGCADLDPGCQTPHMYGVRSPYKRLLGVQLTFKEFADGLLFVNFKHDLVMSWLQFPAVVTSNVD